MATSDKQVDKDALFVKEFLDFVKASVGINQAAALIGALKPWQFAPNIGRRLPYIKGWLIENVQVFCTAVAATASVDVLIGAASVLTAAVVPVAGNIVQGALVGRLARIGKPTDQLNIRVTTNGTGTITDLAVLVTIRPFALNGEADDARPI